MGKTSPYFFPAFLILLLFLWQVPVFTQDVATEREELNLQWIDSLYHTDSLAFDTLTSEQQLPVRVYEWLGPHSLPAGSFFEQQAVAADQSPVYITSWILFSVLLIGLSRSVFPMRFREVLLAVWKARYYNQLEREGGVFSNWVSFFLFVNYLFCVALLFYQILFHMGYLSVLTVDHPGIILLYGLTFSAAWYILKFLIAIFGGWVFKTARSTESVLRTSLTGNNFAGVILLPVLVVNTYNPSEVILYFAISLVLGMELLRIIRISAIGLRIRSFSAYHLILYLCTIEIIPVLFLIKYAGNFL
jgi:hypothetical protein